MRLLVGLIVALSTILCAPYNVAGLPAIAQPSNPQSAVPSDDGAVFGPGASWGGPPTLIPADGAEVLTAQTSALGSLIQTAIVQHTSWPQEAVERALRADINTSLGLGSSTTADLGRSALSLERESVATIVPGHAFGPVTLGMSTTQADEAAARFARMTGRSIDVLFRKGVVVAAGSTLALPIDVRLPDDSNSFLPRDAIGGQSALEVSGSPDQLVNAFRTPKVIREGRANLALIFAAGLVANVQQSRTRGVVVTYLAVQAPGTTALTAIGLLAQRSAELPEPTIVPGRSFGPVLLGMPIQQTTNSAPQPGVKYVRGLAESAARPTLRVNPDDNVSDPPPGRGCGNCE